MASKVGRMIQDQNLSIHSDGASVAGKGECFKSIKKGGLGVRKPLGDVSNRGKLQSTKASKKAAPTNFTENNSGASLKGLSKTSDKGKINWSQKPLSDVSNNTVKPLKKNSSVVEKESCCDFEEEGFLHDHKRCIEAMSEAAQRDKMEIFRMIHGSNPSILLSSPSKDDQLTKFEEEESLAFYLDEKPENESLLHFKYDSSVASPRSSPSLSPDRFTNLPKIWEDCDFEVIGSP